MEKKIEAIFVALFIFFGIVPFLWLILGVFQIPVNPYILIAIGLVLSIGLSYYLYK